MSTYARAVVSVPSLDLTLDGFSNSFVFKSDAVIDWSGTGPLFTALKNFYNVVGTGSTLAIASHLSETLDRGTNHGLIELYDITAHLAGTPAGAPVASTTWTLAAAASGQTSYPEGVAATLSFRADYGTDVEFGTHARPRARDRNRVYVGPLNSHAFGNDGVTNRCLLNASFMNDCLGSIHDLSASIDISGQDWVLQVWSRVNAATKLPTEAWMDNRPDYQRRRSDPNPGSRTFRALAAP